MLTLGVRHETLNPYERRAPLVPSDVQKLVDKGITVLVESSTTRIYSNSQYEAAGATIVKYGDIGKADVILGIKQVPRANLYPNKTYVFFSHTIKGQKGNMSMLEDILAKKITLIDYEVITDSAGKRLIKFGKYAGIGGAVDTLSGLGRYLLKDRQLGTPFIHTAFTFQYPSLKEAYNAMRLVGKEIEHDGLPQELVPFIVNVTGTGAVSSGVLEVLRHLPHEFVSVDGLPSLMKNGCSNKVYILVTGRTDMFYSKMTNRPCTIDQYEKDPNSVYSVYPEKIAPFVSVIFHCAFWSPNYPRIMTTDEARSLSQSWRCLALGDVTADVGGSFEFMNVITSFDEPFAIWKPLTNEVCLGTNCSGLLLYSIDHIPSEVSKEASEDFSKHNVVYAESLAIGKVLPELERAVITRNGHLTDRFSYIQDLRRQQKAKEYHVLLLGCGMVCEPFVDCLLGESDIYLTIADVNKESFAHILSKYPHRVSGVELDLEAELDLALSLIKSHSVVVSLLPPFLHPKVAELCVEANRHFVSSSYISPAIKTLAVKAQEKGVILLNEVGLDPGLDIASLAKQIDELKRDGFRILSVKSYTGGLAPPSSLVGNPLNYTFSWRPLGVLQACSSSCSFLEDGEVVTSRDPLSLARVIDADLPLSVVGYPNRDSILFAKNHGVWGETKTFIRGTLRYRPFPQVLHYLKEIGYLNKEEHCMLNSSNRVSFNEFTSSLMAEHPHAPSIEVLAVMRDLGLFSHEILVPEGSSPIEVMANFLGDRFTTQKGEEDLVLMWHELIYEKNGKRKRSTSLLVRKGTQHSTAMAETVGKTAAIGVLGIKHNQYQKKGLLEPRDPEVYRWILEETAKRGIEFVEVIHDE
ncbi:hypothetical protein P9112_008886 [Eukaryota sp. TZLM1-RC]